MLTRTLYLAAVGFLSLGLTARPLSLNSPVDQEGCTIVLHNEHAIEECFSGAPQDCNEDETIDEICCHHAHMAMNWKVCWDSGVQTGQKCDPTVPKSKAYYIGRDSYCNGQVCTTVGGWSSCSHFELEDKLINCPQ